jgi:hypothetical protein
MFRSLFHYHFRGRPSFLVHLLPFSCLLRHLSFFGMWPYALYLYVSGVAVCVLSGRELGGGTLFHLHRHVDK